MTDDFPYSDAQRTLVETPGSLFVEACPGAGKTRAIVGRFLRRVQQEPRKGIALLSFTNAAVDEAKARSVQGGATIQSPHFIGTFDSFINRQIVAPIFTTKHQIPVRFIDSWASVAAAVIRLDGERSAGYSLDYFSFDPNFASATFVPERIPFPQRSQALGLPADARALLEQRARTQLHRLAKGDVIQPRCGLMSAEVARNYATNYLGLPEWKDLIVPVLAARFAEIIVDEAQDCGPEELAILTVLKDAGVAIVMVGDLDQAIYEFRRSQPDQVRAFASQLPPGRRLDGNYRSTPAICSVVASLRSGNAMDEPVGEHGELNTPVSVLPFGRPREVQAAVTAAATALGFTTGDDVMVLAHKSADAMKAAGARTTQAGGGSHRVLRIAANSLVLGNLAATARQRLTAVTEIERGLLDIAGCADDGGGASGLQQLGATPRWLRDQAHRLALGLSPEGMETAAYTEALRVRLREIDWPRQVDLKQLRSPTAQQWRDAMRSAPDPDALRFSTIHGAKGLQYPVAAVVLPEELISNDDGHTCLDLWENDLEGEAKRVLYVATSRAERLLILAVHSSHVERVTAILDRNGVPHTLAS
ncbi:UvrD-helicase domain-containing protein [Arsenicicoccus cauae]|uniref:UvrD-helicase domain-containing protein n=1 Tax=Arsenicicoccus cauae TaxID=2663847 RepID=UPI00370D94EC